MASATSNSNSINSFYTTRSVPGPANAIGTLFGAIALLEQFENAHSEHGFAWTISDGTTNLGSTLSQVSVPMSVQSQVTMMGPPPPSVSAISTTTSRGSIQGPPRFGGLVPDDEGKETRKQMLNRRRQECSAEEVDVALAPVTKVPVPYVFYPDQYKRFRQLFPRVNVDSGLAFTHHDHPVAHTATLVGIRYMQSMFKHGQRILDLHGNPNMNENFNRFSQRKANKRGGYKAPKIDTLVEMKGPADAVRKITKWGAEFDDNKDERWLNMSMHDVEPDKYDVFMSVHTLYYYSMYEVNKLLDKNRGSKLIALVNYEKNQMGTLYGELKYSKVGGMTTQHSPNGESYHHPDIDSWFQHNSFRGMTDTISTGISWTSTNVGGPLYLITIVSCDSTMCRYVKYDPPSAPTLKVAGDGTLFGIMRIGGADVRLRISNADLASELRHFMVFRDRTDPKTFLDLVVKARRCTAADNIDNTRQFYVNDGELQDHIAYAYNVDAPGELELLEGIKLLKGDLLDPLSEALKFEGDLKTQSVLRAMFQWLIGKEQPKQALKARNFVAAKHKSQFQVGNTGGLLPINRT